MWSLRPVIVFVLSVLFITFAFEPWLSGALVMPRAGVKVINRADDRLIPCRTPVTATGQAVRDLQPRRARDLRQPADMPTVTPGATTTAAFPEPAVPNPSDPAGAGATESSTTVTPPPASPVSTPVTPASAGQPRRSLAELRRQGITPALLLAGDLLLLIVALIIVIIDRRKRPR